MISLFLRMRKFSGISCRENQNSYFMFNNFFQKSCLLWYSVEKYDAVRQPTHGNIIRPMRIACWITKATDTHSEYVTIFFPRQQWTCLRASMLLCTYSACLFSECVNFAHIVNFGKKKSTYFVTKFMLLYGQTSHVGSSAVVWMRENSIIFRTFTQSKFKQSTLHVHFTRNCIEWTAVYL